MKRLSLSIAAILSISMLLVSFTNAQHMDRRCINQRLDISERLSLTDQQETTISELRINHQKEMIDLRSDVKKKEIELQEIKLSGTYTRDEYIAKVSEITDAKNKIEIAQASHQMDVYEILDEDQKKTWNETKMKMNQHKKQKIKKFRDRRLN